MLFVFIMVAITCIGLTISLVIHFGYKVNKHNSVGWWFIDIIPGTFATACIGLLAIGVLSLIMSLTTVTTARNLETFYYDNNELFLESTIEIKEGVRDSGGEGYLFFDAARKDHITIYNGQVQEYKKNVVKYNLDLRRHRYWQHHIVFGVIYADVGSEVQSLPTLGFSK